MESEIIHKTSGKALEINFSAKALVTAKYFALRFQKFFNRPNILNVFPAFFKTKTIVRIVMIRIQNAETILQFLKDITFGDFKSPNGIMKSFVLL